MNSHDLRNREALVSLVTELLTPPSYLALSNAIRSNLRLIAAEQIGTFAEWRAKDQQDESREDAIRYQRAIEALTRALVATPSGSDNS